MSRPAPVIDCHVHLVAAGVGGCLLSPRYRRGLVVRFLRWRLGLTGLDDVATSEVYLERLLAQLDACDGLDGLVLLPLDGRYDDAGRLDLDHTSLLVTNDYCFEACRRDPRLLPAASVNPRRRDALDELDRVAKLGAVCVKTIPNTQAFDPADGAFRPFFRRLADLGLPLLTHTGDEHTVPVERQAWGRPARLLPALEEGVTVIAAHAGTAGPLTLHETFGELVGLAARFPNLYADLSALGSASRARYYRRVLETPELEGRLIYGSDYPVPTSPLLFVRRLGLATARRIAREGGDLSRPLALAREIGVRDADLRRAASVLRVDTSRVARAAP